MRQPLHQRADNIGAAPAWTRDLVGTGGLGGHRLLVEHVERRVPRRTGGEHVAVLAGDGASCLGEEVVGERRVVAAADRPEERRRDRLTLDGVGAVNGHEEPGGAIVFFHRVIEDRQVEQRNPLHLEDGVSQERVVVGDERDVPGRDLPARRRLHARGEAPLDDPVLGRPELVQLLPPEIRVRLLRAVRARLRLLANHRRPGRLVEGAGLGLRVEL